MDVYYSTGYELHFSMSHLHFQDQRGKIINGSILLFIHLLISFVSDINADGHIPKAKWI